MCTGFMALFVYAFKPAELAKKKVKCVDFFLALNGYDCCRHILGEEQKIDMVALFTIQKYDCYI